MPANIILVHDDPKFGEEAAAALKLAGYDVMIFRDPMKALDELEAAPRFDVLITRARFPPGRPNGVALAQMAKMKQPGIKVLFTVAPENVEYTEELGEVLAAPIDIPELVATVTKLTGSIGA